MAAFEDDDEIEHIYLEEEEVEPRVSHQVGVVSAVDSEEERKKFRRILIGILLVALMLTFVRGVELQRFVADLLAVSLVTFAAIKFADLEAFATVYRNYDIVAKFVRPWGYVLPFILALMGFWYILSDPPIRLDILALTITGTAAVGAVVSYRKKYRRQYAYHKSILRLPFTRVSVAENLGLFLLALVSLFI